MNPQQKIFYTWLDPAGERKLTWKNLGKSNVENDLKRDGVNEFIITEDRDGGRRDSSKRGSYDENIIYWVSFLDGLQRVLLFTKNNSIANNTQSASHMDKVGNINYYATHNLF